jgi:bifunctional N-acetylglucosamine-1-phosphate-uridyltransferase/glucosamine-1-phosphate-acetyltransferase GlmU-like protein
MNTIFLIIILLFILYYMYNYPKNKEDFNTSTLTPDEITVIKNLSPHLLAIKNLSDLATLLMKGSLTIPGGLKITGDANITGSTNIKTDANITGIANITGSVNIKSDANIKGDANIIGKTNITGNTIIKGITYINNNLYVSENVKIDKNLTIGNTTITEAQLKNLLAGKFANLTSNTIDCPSIKIGELKFIQTNNTANPGNDKYAITLKANDDVEDLYYIQFRTNDFDAHSDIHIMSRFSQKKLSSDNSKDYNEHKNKQP